MGKKKSWWDRLDYWKKGSLISILFISFVHLILVILKQNYGELLSPLTIMTFKVNASHYTLFPAILAGENFGDISILTFILLAVWYGLVGFLIGKLFPKFRKLSKKGDLAFFLYVLIVLLVLIPIVNILFLLIFIMPNLGFA